MTERARKRSKGPLIIIGGGEDKEGRRVILREVAKHLDGGRLVLATVASHEPEGYFDAYAKAFADLGVTDLVELYVNDRAETLDPDKLRLFEGAAGVFFSGGDQLRISSQIGDTPIEQRVREIPGGGGSLAGRAWGGLPGGHQLRLPNQVGGPAHEPRGARVHERGGLIAGTSAGASMMSE